eukprot:gene8073-12534_t
MSTYEEAQRLGLIKEIKTEDKTVELLKTIQEGQIDLMVDLLNEDKTLVNKEDGAGRTPLHFAASHDRYLMIPILIQYGANVNGLDLDQYTPLVLAVKHKSDKSIEVLLEKGGDLNFKTSKNVTVMHQAAYNNDIKMMDYLVSKGAKMEGPWSEFGSPFMWACAEGHFEMMEKLFKMKVDVNDTDINQGTALHISAATGNSKVVLWLIAHAANVNAKTKDNSTPLHLAAEFENLEIMSLLIKNGAVLSQDDDFQTPYDIAKNKKNMNIQSLLLASYPELKILVNLKDKANKLFSKKEYKEAIEMYKEYLAKEEHYTIYSNISACYLQLENFEEAETFASKCIEKNPNFIKGYYRKGLALKRQGKAKKAIEVFQKVQEYGLNFEIPKDWKIKNILDEKKKKKYIITIPLEIEPEVPNQIHIQCTVQSSRFSFKKFLADEFAFMKELGSSKPPEEFHVDEITAETKITNLGYKYERIDWNVSIFQRRTKSCRFYLHQNGVLFRLSYSNKEDDFDDGFINDIVNKLIIKQ